MRSPGRSTPLPMSVANSSAICWYWIRTWPPVKLLYQKIIIIDSVIPPGQVLYSLHTSKLTSDRQQHDLIIKKSDATETGHSQYGSISPMCILGIFWRTQAKGRRP